MPRQSIFFLNNWRRGKSRGTWEWWNYRNKEVTAQMREGGWRSGGYWTEWTILKPSGWTWLSFTFYIHLWPIYWLFLLDGISGAPCIRQISRTSLISGMYFRVTFFFLVFKVCLDKIQLNIWIFSHKRVLSSFELWHQAMSKHEM
jgi:hypothetical protein